MSNSPVTVHVVSQGLTELLPTAIPLRHRIYSIQIVNKQKDVVVELLEGVDVRWRGFIPKQTDRTINFGVHPWDFRKYDALFLRMTGSSTLDANILSHTVIPKG